MRVDPHRPAGRVVVDTHVWISAFPTRDGTPAQLVRLLLESRVPVFSDATFAELETPLWRPKFDRYVHVDIRRRLLRELDAAAHRVAIPPAMGLHEYSRDPDNETFIHAALAAGAPLLVTGDNDLLGLAPIDGLRIRTPAQALEEWG